MISHDIFHAGQGKGYDEAASRLQDLLKNNPQLGAYTLSSSVGLHNAAVAAYNSKRFSDAVPLLKVACELVQLPCEGLVGNFDFCVTYGFPVPFLFFCTGW